ncbi:MAG: TadG family pilus assembly protein [Parvibaculaceae bacterium]
MMQRLNKLARAERGSIAILSAVSTAVLVLGAAMAVDGGLLYLDRRTSQGAVDLAALSAAVNIPIAERAARATVERNGITPATLVATPGRYTANMSIAPGERFRAGARPFNAVRVRMEREGQLYFAEAFGMERPTIGVTATAAASAEATFSIGSRLVRLEGGILNALLTQLAGTSIRLTAVDYRALADAQVKLADFMPALASELHLTAGTYDQVLDADASLGQIVDALSASVSSSHGSPSAILALNSLALDARGARVTVPLRHMIDLGPLGGLQVGQTSPGLNAAVSALSMVTGALALSDGTHQASLNLGANVPGLLGLDVKLAIGEPPQNSPWLAVGETGTIVRTAQVRLQLAAKIGGSGLLSGVAIELPVYVEVAYGEARLGDISCTPGDERRARVVVEARPGVVDARIGRASTLSFSSTPNVERATILNALLIKAYGSARVEVGSTSYSSLSFVGPEIGSNVPKTVESRNLVGSLVSSLVGNLNLEVAVGPLSLVTPAALKAALKPVLQTAATPLDGVLQTLLEALGLHLGEADIWVNGVRCDGAVLVQ